MAYINRELSEESTFQMAFLPVNTNTGNNTGQWIKLAEYHRCRIVYMRDAGTTGDDAELTLQQATDLAGDNPKALNFTRYRTKIGAINTVNLPDTLVTQASGNTCTPAFTGLPGYVMIEVKAEDLDTSNGFCYLSLTVGQPGATSYGVAFYEVYDARHPQAAPISPVN